jgi:predicted nucleic acid-binding protein
MIAYYLDASALVKRYLPESGTGWINELMQAGDDMLFSSDLALVEVISALSRAQREKRVSLGHRDRLINQAHVDMQQWLKGIPPSRLVVRSAGELVVTRALRAYDAIHLATALELANDLARLGVAAPTFISADEELLAAARTTGLQTDNPNDHA